MTNPNDLIRRKVSAAIFDPGASEGYKGDRTLIEWQTDAVMRAIDAIPAAPEVLALVEALRYYAVEAMPWDADDSLVARNALAAWEAK